MRTYRHALIASLAVLAGTGCRAMNPSVSRPPVVPTLPTVAVETLVDRHNRNAQALQSLEASPSVTDRRFGHGTGRLALVRPRDFKLTVDKPTGGMIANIGSNDQEFWIWSSSSEAKEIYVGNYNATGQPPAGLLVQPDWVIEALGLQILSPEETRQITAEPGTDASTITLVHKRPNGMGGTTTKKTLVDRGTGLIKEHVFYSPDGDVMLARAWPSDYRTVQTADGGSVFLPERLRIMATPPGEEPMELRITLGLDKVRVNQFDDSRRDIFTVPAYDGYAVVNLQPNEAGPQTTAGGRSGPRFDYETLPTPPAGAGSGDGIRPAGGESGVQLGAPVPLGVEGQTLQPSDPRPRLHDDLGEIPGGIDAIVGQRIPRPPGSSISLAPARDPRLGGSGYGYGNRSIR